MSKQLLYLPALAAASAVILGEEKRKWQKNNDFSIDICSDSIEKNEAVKKRWTVKFSIGISNINKAMMNKTPAPSD